MWKIGRGYIRLRNMGSSSLYVSGKEKENASIGGKGSYSEDSDIKKAQMCESKFKDVHRGANIGEEGIRKRNETLRQHIFKLGVNDDNADCVNLYFSIEELRRAINNGGKTAPGKDGIS